MIKEFVEKILIGKLLCPNFEVDLSTNEGAKILKISVNCIVNQNIGLDIEDESRQDRKIGLSEYQISRITGSAGRDLKLNDLLTLCRAAKEGSKSRSFNFSFSTEKLAQDFYTFGSYPFNDLILTKNFPIGMNTGILNAGGQLRLTDYSNLNIAQVRAAQIIEANQHYPLIVGDLLNFGGVTTYRVTESDPLTLKHVFDLFIEEKFKEIGHNSIVPKIIFKEPQTSIGRLRKNDAVLAYSTLSGAHAVLLSNGFKDIGSTNGSYVYLLNGNTDHSIQQKSIYLPTEDAEVIVGNRRFTINPKASE